jgi:LPXTG-motif cell wall-anchored protein
VPFDPFGLPAIPTLGPPALALLLLVLAGSALVFLRRRRAGS